MKSSMKRLAKDQMGLRQNLPPNYFFEDTDESTSPPDDLTQLSITLAGPEGTPYAQGIWHVRLAIPLDYPHSPPTATFQTRIFHPNVAEETGAVCLETLKRDWDPKLTLKDILVTISCLLIQPNPDSALNQKAGALIQDDYDAFSRQARLMTKIHAPTPKHLSDIAHDARRRGEDPVAQVQQVSCPEPMQSSNAESTDKPILKENQPSQNTGVVKAHEPKPRKRSLAESTICTDDSHDNNSNGGKRKSPRHNLETDDAGSRPNSSVCEPAETKPSASLQPTRYPEKVVFRARWKSSAGASTLKARIGIRRL